MALALVMASAIGGAFESRGLVFAGAYAAMQVGRTAFIVLALGRDHPLAPNYRRMLGWLVISACFWIAGGLAEHWMRVGLWAVAVLCEYASPMTGFALPGLGRSSTRDWTIEGGHLAERCQLFVIVALGETLLATGGVLSEVEHWSLEVVSAVLATFAGTLAMWWLYFGTSSKDATAAITHAEDPGRIGAYFHYVHAILIAGVIATAVGNDLVLAHPHAQAAVPQIAILLAGPAIYLLGSAIYKKVVYGSLPASHWIGALLLLALVPLSEFFNLLVLGWLTTALILGIAFWDTYDA